MKKILYLLFVYSQAFSQTDSLAVSMAKDSLTESEDNYYSAWQNSLSVGVNLNHNLELNSPSGTNIKGFSTTNSLDFNSIYFNEESRFSMSHELHYTIGLFKAEFNQSSPIQRTADELNTIHDLSYSTQKGGKWNFNLIVSLTTSLLSIYDGGYLKDINNFGKIQAFFNPFDISLSPGIKFKPSKSLGISLAPFAMQFYGLTNQQIANTGYYTQEVDQYGNFKLLEKSNLGAELNTWLDLHLKDRLKLQYRLGVSSNYLKNLAKNGKVNGLFITQFRLVSDIYLSHRANLKGDLSQTPLKPNYQQAILLSYTKTF